jgi:hypothetical protein
LRAFIKIASSLRRNHLTLKVFAADSNFLADTRGQIGLPRRTITKEYVPPSRIFERSTRNWRPASHHSNSNTFTPREVTNRRVWFEDEVVAWQNAVDEFNPIRGRAKGRRRVA